MLWGVYLEGEVLKKKRISGEGLRLREKRAEERATSSGVCVPLQALTGALKPRTEPGENTLPQKSGAVSARVISTRAHQ